MPVDFDKIAPELEKKLDPEHTRQREQAGRKFTYVEGWHVIAEANRIFGYGNWQRETIYCKEVCQYDNAKGNKVVGYEAKVRVTVGDVVREGTGYGSGIAKDLFDAIEGAGKEAETDAMKRAMMTFGNPFGLALYDKQQKNVGKEPTAEERAAAAETWTKGYIALLEKCQAPTDFYNLKNDKKKKERLDELEEKYPDFRTLIHDAGVETRARLGIHQTNGEAHG